MCILECLLAALTVRVRFLQGDDLAGTWFTRLLVLVMLVPMLLVLLVLVVSVPRRGRIVCQVQSDFIFNTAMLSFMGT